MLLQIYINISLLVFETSTFQVFLKATSKCAFPRPSAVFLNMVFKFLVISIDKATSVDNIAWYSMHVYIIESYKIILHLLHLFHVFTGGTSNVTYLSLKESLQYHRHKKDTKMTHGICGAIGMRAQVSLVSIKTSTIENAFHP